MREHTIVAITMKVVTATGTAAMQASPMAAAAAITAATDKLSKSLPQPTADKRSARDLMIPGAAFVSVSVSRACLKHESMF
ncbi:MAG: hypothetical protein HFG46_04700 [Clostridium sp.]|nr:hypothetical protein [Clostridium sp.]